MATMQTDTQPGAVPAPDGSTEPPPRRQDTAPGKWTRICAIDDIPRLGARVVRQGGDGPNIAVFRTAADTFFALADRCPHRGGPLSQGIVYGDRVACPLHNTSVELGTGCAVAPDKGEVQRFGVKVEGGAVFVELPLKSDRYAYG
jgi:nitrite reductase (NADH) small subunit